MQRQVTGTRPLARAVRWRVQTDRHRQRLHPVLEAVEGIDEVVVGGRGVGADEAGAGDEALVAPDRADADGVQHLVRDDLVEQALAVEAGCVGAVELHHGGGGQVAAGAQGGGARLAKHAAGAVDRL